MAPIFFGSLTELSSLKANYKKTRQQRNESRQVRNQDTAILSTKQIQNSYQAAGKYELIKNGARRQWPF